MTTRSQDRRFDAGAVVANVDLGAVSLAHVRQRVRAMLSGRYGVLVEDAVQVVDELASNARQHGHPPRACRLLLTNGGRCLRVEVDDTAPELPRLRPPDEYGGRGLLLVDGLSSNWGVLRHARYKTVWAELELEHAATSGHVRHLESLGLSR
jgi:hypothetical protein